MNEGVHLKFKRDSATIESMRRAYAELKKSRKDRRRKRRPIAWIPDCLRMWMTK